MAPLRCLFLAVALLSTSAFARPADKARRALPSDHPEYVGEVVLDEVDFPLPTPARLARRHYGKPSGTPTHTQPTSKPTPGLCADFGLVTNGGLELDSTNGPFYAWTSGTSGPGASGLTLTDSNGACYSGDKCFTVTNSQVPEANALTPWEADFTQTFDVDAGKFYNVFFATKGPGDTNAKVEVDIIFSTKDGAVVSQPPVPAVYPPSVWTPTSYTVQAPWSGSALTATVNIRFIGETCVINQVISVDCVGMKPSW